jgi:outer membrane biogenesis lipoprotein LolB
MITRLLCMVTALLLAACVSVPDMPSLEKKFVMHTGRFAISYQKDGAPQREQGGFEWKVQTDLTPFAAPAMQLALLSPLGNTVALIAFNPQAPSDKRASLTTPTQIEFAPDLPTLMQELLGWRLPLAELLPWLGKTSPAQPPEDWLIVVASRHPNGLPRLITASHEALNLQVRLVFEP